MHAGVDKRAHAPILEPVCVYSMYQQADCFFYCAMAIAYFNEYCIFSDKNN